MNYHHRGPIRAASDGSALPITQASAFQQLPGVHEKYYADGDPQWLEGRNQHPCQTVEQAEKAWKRDIKHLRKKGQTSPEHDALAEHIEGCRPNARCRSGACALCRRAFQRWFVSKVPKLLAKLGEGHPPELAVISIIPDIHIRGGGDLQHLTRLLRDVIKSLNEAFDKAGTTIVIGGIDISRNIHKGRLHRPFFQLHFWGFAPFDEAQRAKAILGNTFPKSKVTKRPVWVKPKPFDGNIAGYAYGMKANFSQRHTIPKCIDEDGELKRQNTRNGKQMTVAENQSLLTMLAILGLGGRLILQGVTLTENDNGYAKLRLDKGEADGD